MSSYEQGGEGVEGGRSEDEALLRQMLGMARSVRDAENRGQARQPEREKEARGPQEPPAQEKALEVRYDSAERRAALAQHLSRMGVVPELAAVRMLMEVGQAQSVRQSLESNNTKEKTKEVPVNEKGPQVQQVDTPALEQGPGIKYDSPERRAALEQHLSRMGVAPEQAAIRILMEVGQAQSVEQSLRGQGNTDADERRVRELDEMKARERKKALEQKAREENVKQKNANVIEPEH